MTGDNMQSPTKTVFASFKLYGRVYCHLCHEMKTALEALLKEVGHDGLFALELIDVDEDEALEERFGELVPVLVADDRELCHYFLDVDAVRAYLTEIR